METKRAYAIPVLLAAVVLAAASLSAYVGSYLLSGEYGLEDDTVWRAYDHDWQVELFTPLGRAEKFLTGHDVISCVEQPQKRWKNYIGNWLTDHSLAIIWAE